MHNFSLKLQDFRFLPYQLDSRIHFWQPGHLLNMLVQDWLLQLLLIHNHWSFLILVFLSFTLFLCPTPITSMRIFQFLHFSFLFLFHLFFMFLLLWSLLIKYISSILLIKCLHNKTISWLRIIPGVQVLKVLFLGFWF